jgi:DNA polymerase II large subunit
MGKKEIKSNEPDGTVYPISTLEDIYKLPSYDHMDRCLTELRKVLLETRAHSDAFARILTDKGVSAPYDQVIQWPENIDWEDDGKGEIDLEFIAPDSTLTVSIRSDKSKDNQ